MQTIQYFLSLHTSCLGSHLLQFSILCCSLHNSTLPHLNISMREIDPQPMFVVILFNASWNFRSSRPLDCISGPSWPSLLIPCSTQTPWQFFWFCLSAVLSVVGCTLAWKIVEEIAVDPQASMCLRRIWVLLNSSLASYSLSSSLWPEHCVRNARTDEHASE